MSDATVIFAFLEQEARALLDRLRRVKSFAQNIPMVPAANLPIAAQAAIEKHLIKGRHELRRQVESYLQWLSTDQAVRAGPEQAQRRLTLLRLKFNATLAQLDIFADVLNQRSEHETGVWLSGLDVLAADALTLDAEYFEPPPMICHIDRGHGAAIRRTKTRLPGGGENPVAVIRIPRERMVGSSIASSLIHEVGHEASAQLKLLESLGPILRGLQSKGGQYALAWRCWEKWLSEILSDYWAVGKLGIGATLGLIGVVSLPRPFVFQVNLNDPHPVPWMRVRISCAMGAALYPHPHWAQLAELWSTLYPPKNLDKQTHQLFQLLEATMQEFTALLINHRPRSLRGRSLKEIMPVTVRQPAQLAAAYESLRRVPGQLLTAPPTLLFAIIGQARANGKITPEAEGALISQALTRWALQSSLDTAAICAARPASRQAA